MAATPVANDPPVNLAGGLLPAALPTGAQAGSITAELTVSIPKAVKLAAQMFDQGRRAEAESICLEILTADPEQPDALHLCGAIAHKAGKHGLALALIEKAARLLPDSAQARYNLGVVWGALQRRAAAIECFRTVLRLQPGHAGALQYLGNYAFEDENFTEAQRCYEAVLSASPNSGAICLALGLLWSAQRQVERARHFFERALKLEPDNARYQWEAAQLFLLQGDFERGWRCYEARFPAGNECKVWHYPFPFPRWQGEPLAGKHLLVHGEQGLGDEIMFLSIVPELLAEGARISLAGQPHLHALWRDTFPDCASHVQLRANEDAWTRTPPPWLAQIEPVDYQIPFGSLPLIRRSRREDFTRQKPYLRTDPGKVGDWAAWLEEKLGPRAGRLRVGLVWAGNPAPNNPIASRKDARRSLPLSQFFGLNDLARIDWISLQTWQAAEQLRNVPAGFRLLDCKERLTDFSQTAALVDQLDLVISVDTSVCHLAGALGKPVWILLPFVGEWRWGLDPDRCLWWPSARLFRQDKPGNWAGVVARVRAALETALTTLENFRP